MRNETPTQLDQAEKAIITRLQARIDDPRFNRDTTYTLALRHAIDVVRMEADLARESW